MFLQGWKKKMDGGGGEKVRMKLISNVYSAQVCSLKTMKVKNGFAARNV